MSKLIVILLLSLCGKSLQAQNTVSEWNFNTPYPKYKSDSTYGFLNLVD